jgi:hypothetical protein
MVFYRFAVTSFFSSRTSIWAEVLSAQYPYYRFRMCSCSYSLKLHVLATGGVIIFGPPPARALNISPEAEAEEPPDTIICQPLRG